MIFLKSVKYIFLSILKSASKIFLGSGIGRYKLIAWFYHLVVPLLRPDYVKVDGHIMYLDKKDSLSLSVLGFYEPSVSWAIQNEIKKGMTVIDVGANIGYFTLLMARCVGASGKVYAFEPDPENFNLLRKNVRINGYKNVILVKAAVARKKGKIGLFVNENSNAEHSIYSFSKNQKKILVNSWSLDEYFSDKDKKVDFVKLDIQGAEPEALLGMKKLIRKNPKIEILTEVWPLGLEKSKVTPGEFIDKLRLLGFKICLLRDDKKYVKKEFSKKSALLNLRHYGYLNILCYR